MRRPRAPTSTVFGREYTAAAAPFVISSTRPNPNTSSAATFTRGKGGRFGWAKQSPGTWESEVICSKYEISGHSTDKDPRAMNEHESDLVKAVIGAAYEVSNVLGAGFSEKIYERALTRELACRCLAVKS